MLRVTVCAVMVNASKEVGVKENKSTIPKQVYVNDEQQYLILSNLVPTCVSSPDGTFIKAAGWHNSQPGFIIENSLQD